jgi:stage II sporulation protein E
MLSATGGEKFATVDLCLIDLWTGETAMNKLGACPSFILQGQKIHTVEGAALPLGIIEHVVPMEHTFTLGEGDTLLLMSDGISEAFEEEESILELLRRCREEPPQKLADSLLREALMQRDGLPPDDMTVLCARVTERQKRGRHSG